MNNEHKVYIANGAIIFMIGLGLVSWLKSALTKDVIPPCSERYATYLTFPENVGMGERISDGSIELHLDQDVQGLSEYTRVIQSDGDVSKVVFETRLPKGSNNPRRADGIKGGMGFAWQPRLPKKATSACLTYKVWLPKDFKFAKGGTLPGLFGGEEPGLSGYEDKDSGFSTNILWNGRGLPVVRAYTSNIPKGYGRNSNLSINALPTNRWVTISQEIILNTPGQTDGTLRAWIDGELVHEAANVLYRKNKKLQISGVLGDLYYDGIRKEYVSPKDTFVRITPFVLNWD